MFVASKIIGIGGFERYAYLQILERPSMRAIRIFLALDKMNVEQMFRLSLTSLNASIKLVSFALNWALNGG